MNEEDSQRLCLLVSRNHSEPDDEVLLENWDTVKGEIIAGRIYGYVRANFPELSHELLAAASLRGEEGNVGNPSVVEEENALAEVPFTFSSKVSDDIVSRIQLASDHETLHREIMSTLKRERWRDRRCFASQR
jgi:hypothetical protein